MPLGILALFSLSLTLSAYPYNSLFLHLLKVESRTSIPLVVVAVVTTILCLLSLIYISSSTVYEDVISLSVSGLYALYFIPCAFLLWRRTTGQIVTRSSDENNNDDLSLTTPVIPQNLHHHDSIDNSYAVVQPPLVWGPWRLPGLLGMINNAFACVYIIFVIFWSFWPPETPATRENMNYSVVVTGTVIIFSIVYYYIWGKKQYLGPLIEREVHGIAIHEE